MPGGTSSHGPWPCATCRKSIELGVWVEGVGPYCEWCLPEDADGRPLPGNYANHPPGPADEIRRLCREYGLTGEHVGPGGRLLTFPFGGVLLDEMPGSDQEDLRRVKDFVGSHERALPKLTRAESAAVVALVKANDPDATCTCGIGEKQNYRHLACPTAMAMSAPAFRSALAKLGGEAASDETVARTGEQERTLETERDAALVMLCELRDMYLRDGTRECCGHCQGCLGAMNLASDWREADRA